MQEKIMNMLFNEDELTWQNIIYEAVKKEEMNPWDIDISKLSQRFLDMVRKLKEMDFRISGKIILAAAILLRIKCNRLVGEDLNQLNRLIAMSEASEDELFDALEEEFANDYSGPMNVDDDQFKLIPRTPQPRKRKVSVYDLVDALEKALTVEKRRKSRLRSAEDTVVEIPEKQVDISKVIFDVYGSIREFLMAKKKKKMSFSELVPSESKSDLVYTFIPLLHLDSQRRIDLEQKEHLGEITLTLNMKYDSPEVVKEEY